MDSNKRPDTMERITKEELLERMIALGKSKKSKNDTNSDVKGEYDE